MNFRDAYEAIVATAAGELHREHVGRLRHTFSHRTGAFGAEDSWFELRSRAFWDDALTFGALAVHVADELDAGARDWVLPLARAHRGLFHAEGDGRRALLRDVWSGAEFILTEFDEATADLLRVDAGLFDGRVAARRDPLSVVLLPGAIFHPEDARTSIAALLEVARVERLPPEKVFDALLRMERNLRSLARVKAAFAYRAEALSLRE